jgi:hypothetical protein
MKRFLVLLTCSALLPFVIGCAPTPAPAPTKQTKGKSAAKKDGGHAHGAGPHGGAVTDWGGGAYHVEFTVDHDQKEATVYLLGSDEKSPSPIKAKSIQLVIDDPKTELELVAKPLDGEAEGTSSRFVGSHDTIGIVKEFAGTISAEIEGTPYTGDFKEEPHDDDHK